MKRIVVAGSPTGKLTFATAYEAAGDSIPANATAPVDVSVASPGVVTHPGHGFTGGEAVVFEDGTLPTGLSVGTTYFVKSPILGVSYNLAATYNGTAIDTTGSVSSGATIGLINEK